MFKLSSRRVLGVVLLLLLPLIVAWPASAETRTGSSVEFGGDIIVPEGTVYRGDAVAIFGSVTVNGKVDGDAVSILGSVTVNGEVNGDAVAVGGRITMGDTGVVRGDATSVGGKVSSTVGQIYGSTNSVNVGSVLENIHFMPGWRWNWQYANWGGRNPFFHLFLMAGLLAIALVTTSLFPNSVKNVAVAMEEQPGRSILVGLLGFFLIIPLSVMLAITVVGIPLIPFLWLALVGAKVLGYAALVTLLGRVIGRSVNVGDNQLGRLALGVGILGLVGFVPILSGLVSLGAGLIQVGAAIDSRFGTNRPWLPPKQKTND